MKKKIILISISSLLTVSNAYELNLFSTVGNSELMKRLIEASDHNSSPTDHNISSFFTNASIDMTSGDAEQGQKIFTKKLLKYCDLSSAKLSVTHTQDEWETIAEAGDFGDEFLSLCPQSKPILNPNWLPHLYQFVYEYASDSGNIPSCND